MVAADASGEAGRRPAWLLLPPIRGGIARRLSDACVQSGRTFGTPTSHCVAPREVADHLHTAIGAIGLARAFVVGLSFGGQVAQALLQFRPERVAGLLLIASGAPDRARGAALRRSRWAWRWLPAARRVPRERLMASDLEGATEPGAFATARLPVHLLELGADAVISPDESARLRALFPQATRTVVARLGHDALVAWPDPLHDAAIVAMDALLSAAARAGSR